MKTLAILISIISSYCFSQESQYERIKSRCIDNKDWSKVSCNYVDDNGEGYTDGGGPVGFVVTNLISGISEGLQLAYDFSLYTGTGTTIPFRKSTGSYKREAVINLISGYLKENRVSTCQKTCLIKCVSSKVLDYVPNAYSKFGSVKAIYNCEEGVCTEFSRVFDDLAYQFDISSRKSDSLSMGHSFNKVKIDGQWVYLEPQSPYCDFYTKNPEDFKYEPTNINYSDRNYAPKYELNITPIDNTRVVNPSRVISQ